MASNLEIAVVGGEGVVGREVLGALLQRDFPGDHLTVLGSERSEGDEVEYGEETLEIEKATEDSFRGKRAVIFATPDSVSRTFAPIAQQQGAWVVDLSDAFRRDEKIPLVLPGVNDGVLESEFQGRIVSVPTPIPTALALLSKPLLELGLQRFHVTALVGASSLGDRGIRDLEKQTVDLLSGREPEETIFPHRLALNFIPHVGEFIEASGETSEEASWQPQLTRLLPGKNLTASGLAILVPTFYGHGLSLVLEGGGLTADSVKAALKGRSDVKLLDEPKDKVYPMPMLVTADEAVHVGRIRDLPGRPNAVQLFAAIDNAGRGAAVAAVEAALKLANRS